MTRTEAEWAIWSREHRTAFQTVPLVEAVKGERVQVGFALTLYVAAPMESAQETNGPAYMSSFELARMYAAKGDNKQAATYFGRAFEEGQAAGLEKHDPIGFADMIDDYAKSLGVLGEISGAEDKRRIASAIGEANKSTKTKTDLTPYGTQCVKQQG